MADNYLSKALSLAEAGQWINFWEWHDETIYTMCSRAVLKNIHTGWAARLLSRWFPLRSCRELGSLLLSQDEQLLAFAGSLFQDMTRKTGVVMLHVFFLGRFRLFINGCEIDRTKWKTQKAEKLVKYLAADRRQHTKEELIEQLWPDDDLQSGDVSLRTTLNYVRKAFEMSEAISGSVILRRGKVYLNPGIEVYCDYELFSKEARKAIQYAEAGSPYAMTSLEQSSRLYTGSFLPGDIYDDWANSIRTYLHNLYLEVLVKLSQAHYAKNNLAAALHSCRQYLDLDAIDEQVIRLSMKILYQMGKKQKALSMYRELEAALTGSYNTAPDPETTMLYESIQKGIK